MTIDLREHDQHQHGLKPSGEVALEYSADLRIAQKIRDDLRAQGYRIPLTEAEAFAEAEKRLRGGA
ncbi:MAG: hypothetical protein ACREPQ_09745 [Rhodanobacter sp.]